jgi:ribosomal protein S24E
LDNENDLDWKTTDDFDGRNLSDLEKKEYNDVMNEIASIESIPCYDLEERIIQNFKRQVGEALVRNLQKDYTNAKNMLSIAKQYVIDRSAEKSRYLYLMASGCCTSIFVLIGILLWLTRCFWIEVLSETVFYLMISLIAGSIGAFLSIILRMGKTNLDYHASKRLHYSEACTKIIAGMIGALLVSLCIKCEIILPVFSKTDFTYLSMIIGGIVAGASERLVPSIINKLDGKTNE